MSEWVGVVLAAGEGRRMNSRIPKVLHQVCGKPMISHVVEGLKQAGVERVHVVVSRANGGAFGRCWGIPLGTWCSRSCWARATQLCSAPTS